MTTDILELTQTDRYIDAFIACYTDAEIMAAWCAGPETLVGKLRRASHCLDFARNPRARFGLTAEQTAAVVPVLEAFVAECKRRAAAQMPSSGASPAAS